jgi:FkbH-like protein
VDDRNRITDYKAQLQRGNLEKQLTSKEDFLVSLGIVCQVVNAVDAPLNRTVQLLSKTNQFNLTSRRHSLTEVEMLANKPGNIAVALRVRDRFGDSGVVGVALCHRNNDTGIIDTFLLSCRVIGRGIESALLWHLSQEAIKDGITTIIGEYIPTPKNSVCSTFYTDHGFRLLNECKNITLESANSQFYCLDLTKTLPEKPHWISFD